MKKKIFKKLLIVLFVILVIAFAYNLFNALTTGKQILEVTTSREVAISGTVEAVASVKDKKTDKSIKSNLTVELKNDKNRKVKKFKETYKIEEGEKGNISIPLPENLEAGTYTLKFTSRAGIKTDTEEITISVTDKSSSDVVISLDKGIYKPGDEVNFRALLLSKIDNTPKSEDVEISIFDANSNRVYINKTKTSEFGIVSGKFTLADEVNSGEYKIVVATKNYSKSKTFTVNPYVAPTFEVALETSQDTYQVDETVPFAINARYFFGEPVVNASITGTINHETFTGLTNENGVFESTYELNEVGKYEINVEVVDSSNYLIEASKTIYAENNPFEVTILPEHGNIILGVDNKIGFLSKKVDGTPVKTRMEVTIGGELKRQVITDEAGIGSLTLTADEINSIGDYADIVVLARDMNETEVSSSIDATVVNYSGTVASLDKLKYKQGEDITLNLKSSSGALNKEAYIFKNNSLLKIVSTDEETVKVNLGDTYGLVDIYTKNNISRNHYWVIADYGQYSNYTKTTIFIKPEKSLNIDVSTDKKEYKPGDKLNLNLKTTNENGDKTEAGVLVSILDEAILALADNDLSIDNIRLALGDIELNNDITMADLYAEILDETAESKLRVALLRQEDTNPSIIQMSSIYNNEKHEQYIMLSFLLGGIVALFAFMYLANKSSKICTAIVGLLNIMVIGFLIYVSLYNLLWSTDIEEFAIGVISAIITLILYALVLYKINAWIFGAIIDLIVMPGILAFIVNIIYYIDYNDLIPIIVLLVPAVIMTILIIISRKFRLNRFWNTIREMMTKLTIVEVIYVLTFIFFDSVYIDIEILPIVIVIALYWLSQKIYTGKKNLREKKTIEISAPSSAVVSVVLIIGILVFLYIYNSPTNSIHYLATEIPIAEDDLAFNTMDMVATSKGESFGTNILDVFDKNTRPESTNTSDIINIEESSESNNTADIEDNVRNVFLESLAFIPEMVTTNGEATESIDISDNITTWNIQTVGNTKDGRVGHSSSNFKVFKEFFIDYSLPTNSVVTDSTNIPVTIYNYMDKELNVNIKVKENDWSSIGNYRQTVSILPNSTQMIYIPLEILKAGKQTLRVEAEANDIQDIVEKSFIINPNGFRKTKVVSSGSAEKKLELDHFTTDKAIENTRNLKVKLYPSIISQTIEGMENIFKMPTGCFEQTSSSLYPNILALKYLEDTGLDAPEIKEKALEYISKGYQRILTFETSTPGGYSLYGHSPAENVLTAFGLMELTDLQEVYDIDENVTYKMKEYLFSEQKINGTFDIGSTYIGTAASEDDLAMNAYIIWALTEVCPEDERLEKSVKYLEDKLDSTSDNYTLALMANVFSNTNSNSTKRTINKLLENVQEDSQGGAYISSKIKDYWGCYGRYQDVQATSLASMALSKEKSHNATNKAFLQHIISSKDASGTWSTTQGTILALKAINTSNSGDSLANQKITVNVGSSSQEVEIGDNPLDLYEVTFTNVIDENKISLNIPKGSVYYEIVEEYYVDYAALGAIDNDIKVTQIIDQTANVTDIISQHITVTNTNTDEIRNGLVQISIPQGCSVNEQSLSKLELAGLIEKYEYNYATINLYLRNFKSTASIDLNIEYRANYPEQITGGMVRVYDYYNPSNEGFAQPVNILVNE